MAKDEQKVASTASEKAKPTRSKGKSKALRHVPLAEATAIGRKLSEDEVKRFVGLIGSHGLNQEQFCRKLVEICRAPSTFDKVDNAKRQIQYVFSKKRKWNAPLAAECAKTLSITIKEFDENLRSRALAGEEVSPQPPTHPTIDDRLLSDYLTGVGFAEWLGSEDKWIKTIRAGKERLKANPEDFYCRGMLLWSVLNTGNPSEMIEILNETARWLVSSRPVLSNPEIQFDTQAWRQEIDHKIQQLSSDAVEHPMFVRWHVEDTLVRAALMRYLKFHAAGSQLEREFANLGRDLEKQIVMKWLFSFTNSQRGDSWVGPAVENVSRWAGYELQSGLARLCLLWFTGRQRQRDQMQLAIDQSCQWLEENPNHAFVRWATLWLIGLLLPLSRSEEPVVRGLIEKSAEWLETRAAKEDRLVRMGFLWLVGACGNPAEIQRAIEQTDEWLIVHRDDDFIRVAYLLFLISRKGSHDQRRQVIAKTRQWLRKHPDVHELTNIAVCLCESAPERSDL